MWILTRIRLARRRAPSRPDGPAHGQGQLLGQYQAVCAATGVPVGAADMTVVFDAGQNSAGNFAHLPATARSIIDKDRFGGLTACDIRREAYGTKRRAILTHSPELHAAQAAGFTGTTVAKAGKNSTSWPPPWPAAGPAGSGTR